MASCSWTFVREAVAVMKRSREDMSPLLAGDEEEGEACRPARGLLPADAPEEPEGAEEAGKILTWTGCDLTVLPPVCTEALPMVYVPGSAQKRT